MNQDQIKEKLLDIHKPSEDFSVTLSGKPSKKCNGLYEIENKKIVIHNKNFEKDGKVNENLMMYTAIHEFAHHIRALRGPVSRSRPHDNEYKIIFNDLLKIAIKKGIYNDNIFDNEEFVNLTKTLRENYINKNAQIMKEFGGLLGKAYELCQKYNVRFEDYIERELHFKMSDATVYMRAHAFDAPTEIGLENMKMVARIDSESKREQVQNALLDGEPVESVKQEFIEKKQKPQNVKERLVQEKEELEHKIAALKRKLDQIENQISNINDDI